MRRTLVLALLAALLVAAPSVEAHARFVASEPAPGARLALGPSNVTVFLSQALDPAGTRVEVLDADGRRVDTGRLHVVADEPASATVEMPAGLANGSYLVRWTALSRVDHHTTTGSFGFALGNATPPGAVESSVDVPRGAAVVGRFLFYLGFFAAAGVLAFRLGPMKGQGTGWMRRLEQAGWGLLVAGTGLLWWEALSRLPSGAWSASPVARELLLRVAIGAAGLGAVIGSSPNQGWRRTVAILTLGAAAILSARAGHASDQGWMAWVVDALHLAATAVWVGGLGVLAALLLRPGSAGEREVDLRTAGNRFSRMALASVAVLAASGTLLGLRILGVPALGDPWSWTDGTYGRALALKLAAAAAMVALATVNRYAFLGKLGGSEPAFEGVLRRRFGRFVSAEALLGVVALILASVLTSTSPPYEAPAEEPFSASAESLRFRVDAWAGSPLRAGQFVDLRFRVTALPEGGAVADNTCGRSWGCILLEVVHPDAHEDPQEEGDVHKGGEHRVLEPEGDEWVVQDVLFVEAGHYELLVEIQTGEVYFDVVSLHVEVFGTPALGEPSPH